MRGPILTRLTEASVILAALGSIYWSGRIAERLDNIAQEVASVSIAMRVSGANVIRLCAVVPEAQCER